MHPLPAHGFPRLVRKKSDWGDWVVSPVWFVMEPTAKRSEGWLCPRGFTDTLAVSPICLERSVGCVPMQPTHAAHFSVSNLICFYLAPLCRLFLHAT